MKKQKDKLKSGGRLLAIAILTTVVFVILRLTHIIDWQWVWVFAPLWIGMGLNLVISIARDVIDDIRSWNDINRLK